MITFTDVSLSIDQSKRPLLHNINYDIKHNDFIILLGSNGSGKSTFLKLLNKQYQPTNGSIHYHTEVLANMLTQNCYGSLFPSLTVYENYLLSKPHMAFFTNHQREREFLINYLPDYNPNLVNKLDVLVTTLSGGEAQALALAFCMLRPPALLLLDEHTSALDPKTSAQIMALTNKMVDQHKMTCVLTTHNLDIALQYGNRIFIISEGEIKKSYDGHEKENLNRDVLLNYYH